MFRRGLSASALPLLTFAVVALSACGGDDATTDSPASEAGADAEVSPEAGPVDATVDDASGDDASSADAGADSNTDSSSADATIPDAATDAPADASGDAIADATSDAPTDAPTDAGTDSPIDSGPADAAPDTSVVDSGPRCGDGIVTLSQAEQCDHGASNGVPNDGCSATCQIESGTYVIEVEPNGTQATANSLDGKAGGVGAIEPLNDVDWYSLTVTVAGSGITAEIGDGFGACPGGFDSTLALYSPAGALLAQDQGSGVAPCSKITAGVLPAAANLPIGIYALKVARVSASTVPLYVLNVKITPPSCGDGIRQSGEQCDPGPVSVAGCSGSCQLTGDFFPETEPNDTQAIGNPLGTHAGFLGAINPVGDFDYFTFTVPGPNSLVTIRTSDGIGGCPSGFDSVLSLYNPAHTLIVQDDNGAGSGLCSAISPQVYPAAMNLPAGTYTTRVDYKGGNSTAPLYVVTIDVKQPSCGDGILETSEQCDDGSANGTAGDGCSATCQAIAPWEIEPNNSLATATPVWPGNSTWKGAITPLADHDYFAFTLSAPGKVTLVTHDVDAPTTCSIDTVMHLDDQNGIELANDDDSGPGPGETAGGKCSKISMYSLPAGTFYAWVQHYTDSKVIPKYQLDLTVQ